MRNEQKAERKRQDFVVLGLVALALVSIGLQKSQPAEPLASEQVIS